MDKPLVSPSDFWAGLGNLQGVRFGRGVTSQQGTGKATQRVRLGKELGAEKKLKAALNSWNGVS